MAEICEERLQTTRLLANFIFEDFRRASLDVWSTVIAACHGAIFKWVFRIMHDALRMNLNSAV
jgi:hypothetical protein